MSFLTVRHKCRAPDCSGTLYAFQYVIKLLLSLLSTICPSGPVHQPQDCSSVQPTILQLSPPLPVGVQTRLGKRL